MRLTWGPFQEVPGTRDIINLPGFRVANVPPRIQGRVGYSNEFRDLCEQLNQEGLDLNRHSLSVEDKSRKREYQVAARKKFDERSLLMGVIACIDHARPSAFLITHLTKAYASGDFEALRDLKATYSEWWQAAKPEFRKSVWFSPATECGLHGNHRGPTGKELTEEAIDADLLYLTVSAYYQTRGDCDRITRRYPSTAARISLSKDNSKKLAEISGSGRSILNLVDRCCINDHFSGWAYAFTQPLGEWGRTYLREVMQVPEADAIFRVDIKSLGEMEFEKAH